MKRVVLKTAGRDTVRSLLILFAVMVLMSAVTMLPAGWAGRAYAAENYTVHTVAGTGTGGFSGDNGPAISAQFNLAYHIAVDAAGNLYIPDFNNHVIRKVDTDGIITTVAGIPGVEASIFIPSGDGGPATSATLRFPSSVAFDSEGNMYITELGFERVRKVDRDGIITTVAGSSTGTPGYSGDGGPATSALLNQPVDVAVDKEGNIYIADLYNHVVRKVDGTTGIISTAAGTGTPGYSGDGGQANSAQLSNPYSVDVDEDGNLYIADRNNHRVRKVDASGHISTVAGTGSFASSGDGGPATEAGLWFPIGIAIGGDGTLYVTEFGSHVVRKISPAGIIATIAGTGASGDSGDGGPAKLAELKNPMGIDIDHNGNLYVSDYGNYKIKMLQPAIHTVTFDKTGGDTEADPSTLNVTDGETVDALPVPPTRSGYTFAGWNTQPDGSGTVFNETTVVTGDITVYAQWSLHPPHAPADLQASPGNGQVTLSWDSAAFADYYSLHIGTVSGTYDVLPATVTETTYTVTGLTNDMTYYFAVKAHNAAGASGYSNETQATPSAPEEPADSDSPAVRPTVHVVEGNSGTIVSNAYIHRSIGPGETRKATVVLTRDLAARAIEKLEGLGSIFAKMLIPGDQDEDAELTVKFPKASADSLFEAKIEMEIAATHAHLAVPAASFQGVEHELQFRIEPVKEENRPLAEQEAATDPLVRQAAKGGAIEIAGRPTIIGSNLTGGGYEAILPLTQASLDDDSLKYVAVFAVYEDGSKELAEGSIVPYDGGERLAVRFPISGGGTGTYTVIRWTHPEHRAFLFGYDDGTFGPDRKITRAEIAAMLVRVIHREEVAAGGEFTDLAETHWAKDEIGRVVGMALMTGYPDGSFQPDAPITRAEMAAVIARVLPEEAEGSATAEFTDTAGSWAQDFIRRAAAAGIVNGYEDGTFRPDALLSRAEAVAMLDRLLERGPLHEAPQQWPDVPPSHWAYGYIQESSMDHAYEKKPDGSEIYFPEP